MNAFEVYFFNEKIKKMRLLINKKVFNKLVKGEATLGQICPNRAVNMNRIRKVVVVFFMMGFLNISFVQTQLKLPIA